LAMGSRCERTDRQEKYDFLPDEFAERGVEMATVAEALAPGSEGLVSSADGSTVQGANTGSDLFGFPREVRWAAED